MDDPLAKLMAAPKGDKATVRAALEEARERTWLLTEPIQDQFLTSAATDYLSPPVWDLGHIANFEERWLVQYILECDELRDGFNHIYNAFRHARKDRPKLSLLDREGVRTYMEQVRARALQVLDEVEADAANGTMADYFLHWMLVLHEHQHQETLLQTLQVQGSEAYTPTRIRPLPEPIQPIQRAWVTIQGGPFEMGTAAGACVYDNESPPHTVEVEEFQMARYPVTCGDFLAFVTGGGYTDPDVWSPRGRAWLEESKVGAPMHWYLEGQQWMRRSPAGNAAIEDIPDEILCHVSFFEAEAYARWLGARLPTEAEWEKAARGDGTGHRNPWGDSPAHTEHANVDHLAWKPSRIGSFPKGSSPSGVEHLIGDVWEWTQSEFDGYPDFSPFPYEEYSKVFFQGDYRVLRGGSWATRAGCANGTFRNWDHPYRRQIFAGIRLVRDLA